MGNMFSPPRNINSLIKISLLKRWKKYSFVDLEKELGYKEPQPDVRRVLKFLLENDFLVQSEVLGPRFVRYKINQRKLKKYIDSLEITNLFYRFFSRYHIPPY